MYTVYATTTCTLRITYSRQRNINLSKLNQDQRPVSSAAYFLIQFLSSLLSHLGMLPKFWSGLQNNRVISSIKVA